MQKSIRRKIRSAFNVLNGLTIVVASVGILSLVAVRHNSNKAIQQGARLNAIGLEIQEYNLLARRFEKDFLLNIKTEGVENAKRQYVSQVAPAMTRAEELAKEGAATATSPTDRERLLAVPGLVRTYLNKFEEVVAAIERRGHVDTGAEGEFRTAAHEIEQTVKNSDKLEIALLILRRSEKDYLLRGNQQYITATLGNVEKFKAALASTRLTGPEKASARKSADAYRAAFSVLVNADRDVAEKTAIYTEATRRLEVLSEQVAKAGLKESQASLVTASTTATVSILLVALLSAGVISAGISYGAHISDHITRPVKSLTDVAERVSMGDLSVKVSHTCDDEIGDLEDSLARLVVAVKFFQAERQEALAPDAGEVNVITS